MEKICLKISLMMLVFCSQAQESGFEKSKIYFQKHAQHLGIGMFSVAVAGFFYSYSSSDMVIKTLYGTAQGIQKMLWDNKLGIAGMMAMYAYYQPLMKKKDFELQRKCVQLSSVLEGVRKIDTDIKNASKIRDHLFLRGGLANGSIGYVGSNGRVHLLSDKLKSICDTGENA